jgi:hypothetical protein
VDVYLPDALWLRLHPVKTVRRFVVRFEGKTPKQLKAEAAARAKKAEAARCKVLEAQQEQKRQEQMVARRLSFLRTLAYSIGVAAAGVAGWFLLRAVV